MNCEIENLDGSFENPEQGFDASMIPAWREPLDDLSDEYKKDLQNLENQTIQQQTEFENQVVKQQTDFENQTTNQNQTFSASQEDRNNKYNEAEAAREAKSKEVINDTNAAKVKAEKAAQDATVATNKAESVLSQLPLPDGNIPKKKYSGTMISTTAAYPANPLSLGVEGKTQVNLWKKVVSVEHRGINFVSNDDGSVTVTGKPNANYPNTTSKEKVAITPGKKYTLIGYGGVGTGSDKPKAVYVQISIAKEGYKETKNIASFNSVPVTFEVPQDYVECYCFIGCGINLDTERNATIYPMLVEGDKPQPWTPSGITTVKNIMLHQTNRNLLSTKMDSENFDKGGLHIERLQDGSIHVKGKATGTVFIDFRPNVDDIPTNTRMCLSLKSSSNIGSVGVEINNQKSPEYKSYGTKSQSRTFFTTPQKMWDRFIAYMYFYKDDVVDAIYYPKLEIGDVDTEYQKCNMENRNIDLQGYELCSLPDGTKDELEIDSAGNVTLIKKTNKTTFNGSMVTSIWDINGANEGYVSINIDKYENSGLSQTNEVYCDSIPFGTLKKGYPICVYRTWNAVIIGGTLFYNIGIKQATEIVEKYKPTVVYCVPERRIPLGTIQLPAIPEKVSHIWTSSNMPEVNTNAELILDINEVLYQMQQAITAQAASI